MENFKKLEGHLDSIYSRKSSKKEIGFYNSAEELLCELNDLFPNVLQRMKEFPQLGVLPIRKKLQKSRKDYIFTQIYIHKSAQDRKTNNLMKKKYNSKFELYETLLGEDSKPNKISIGEILQILIIITNIGHFRNTFTSSRGILMHANEDSRFKDSIVYASNDRRYIEMAQKVIDHYDYYHFHLLNSFLLFEKCNKKLNSVVYGKALLYAYLCEEMRNEDLNYIFNVFRTVRDITYTSHDLQLTNVPLFLDISDENSIDLMLSSKIEDQIGANYFGEICKTLSSMLNETVYNNKTECIVNYEISKRFNNKLNDFDCFDFKELFLNNESFLNTVPKRKKYHIDSQILKLFFTNDEKEVLRRIVERLNHTDHVAVGCNSYATNSGFNLCVSVKTTCNCEVKIAFKIISIIANAMQTVDIDPWDDRYAQLVSYFLYYVFNHKTVLIDPSVHKTKKAYCVNGNKKRLVEIENLIKECKGVKEATTDEKYELKSIQAYLENDSKRDLTLVITGSTKVKKIKDIYKMTDGNEFDGIVLYLNRKEGQVVFIEAKNYRGKKQSRNKAIKALLDKFDDSKVKVLEKDVMTFDTNAYVKTTIFYDELKSEKTEK